MVDEQVPSTMTKLWMQRNSDVQHPPSDFFCRNSMAEWMPFQTELEDMVIGDLLGERAMSESHITIHGSCTRVARHSPRPSR